MAKTKEIKTNAMRQLETAGIAYTLHTYDTADGLLDGVSVAEKCGQDPDAVFKTLVTVGDDRSHYVFCVPVRAKLDLKKAAKAAGVKSLEMIPQKELLPLTGYIHGGCSPVGMKKSFATWIDETAVLFETIFVSAGKVGMQVEVNPQDLAGLTNAAFTDITREES